MNFLAPTSSSFPNSLLVSSQSLTITAGAVGKVVGSKPSGAHVVSASVTLVGEGIRHGYSVVLPNSGGQWASNFDQSLLDVQAVGTTAAEVNATMKMVLGRISDALAALQAQWHVSSVNLIRTQLSPSSPQLYYQAGSRIRSFAATLLLGLGVTVAATAAVGRRIRRGSSGAVDPSEWSDSGLLTV